MGNRHTLVKEKIDEIVDSILSFSNCILENKITGTPYSASEIELAQHLRIAIIFYRAREDSYSNQKDMESGNN